MSAPRPVIALAVLFITAIGVAVLVEHLIRDPESSDVFMRLMELRLSQVVPRIIISFNNCLWLSDFMASVHSSAERLTTITGLFVNKPGRPPELDAFFDFS